MCSERDSPLKRLYRRTHAKLTRLAGSGQLIWAPGCEFSLALVHARRPAWPGETSETILRVAPPRKMRPPDHTRVNWPVDASASGSAQVGPGGHHRWAARVQVAREPARQKAREGYPSHYTSLALPLAVWMSILCCAENAAPCHARQCVGSILKILFLAPTLLWFMKCAVASLILRQIFLKLQKFGMTIHNNTCIFKFCPKDWFPKSIWVEIEKKIAR